MLFALFQVPRTVVAIQWEFNKSKNKRKNENMAWNECPEFSFKVLKNKIPSWHGVTEAGASMRLYAEVLQGGDSFCG